ncbi:MAG: hypothetical protein MJZ03_00355 [archaeon]|nr:hypothetical protein [archaeon]
MKSLKVFCDFDDVLINFCEVWISLINEQNNTNVQMDDVKSWNISEVFPSLTKEQIYKPLYETEIWERVTPLPGAVNGLQRLIEDGHQVSIATSSHYKTIATKVDKVLLRYFPFFDLDNLIVIKHKQLLSGDVLIDDGMHNLIDGSYKGILMSAPHNLSCELKDNIYRAYDWDEIYQLVCKMAKGEIA